MNTHFMTGVLALHYCALAVMALSESRLEAQAADKVSAQLGFDHSNWTNRLEIFEEKPITTSRKQTASPQLLRVFLAPCFSKPECFVLESSGTNYQLRHKTLSGKGGYGWGTLATSSRVEVPNETAKRLFEYVQFKKFWQEVSDIELSHMADVRDGTEWWLEYWDGDKSHLLRLRAPEALRVVVNPEDVRDPSPYLELESNLRSVLKSSSEKPHDK